MKTMLKAASAAALALGFGVAAAAPAQAVEVGNISNATRIANGAAIQGTFTVNCTEGANVFVSISVTQAVGEGDIATGGDFEQWTCEGGQVERAYDIVAFNKAFQPGTAVVSGFVQECPAQDPAAASGPICGPGTNLPLILIEIEDAAAAGTAQ